jgi:protein CpxP
MKKTAITIIAALGLSSALMASGHGMHACKHHKERSTIYQTIQQLDLTEVQKKELQALRETQRAERKASRKALKEKRTGKQQRMDLGKFMSAEKFDKEAFKAAMNERMQQRDEMREKRLEAMIEKRAEKMEKFFSILTPEQREKWIQLSQK